MVYFHVFANLHTYRGMVTARHLNCPADAENVGEAFMLNFGLRMFNPIAWATFGCPLREQLWALDSTALDFRAAQNELAMVPREGPWYSSCEDNLEGTVTLTSPLQGATLSLPEQIFVTVRVSLTPAHLVIRFTEAGVLQKISFRPLHNQPSSWREGIFQPDAFTREVRMNHPAMFWIPSEIPPEAAAKMTNPPPVEPEVSESEKADDDWAEDDWHAWNAWYVTNDWTAPGDTLPVPVVPVPEPVFSPKNNLTPEPDDFVSRFFEPRPKESIPAPETSPAEPVSTPEPSPNDSVSVAPSGTRTTMSDAMTSTQFCADFQALQTLAARGRPTTLDDRYARQVYANRLNLAPAVYNMLVFGETAPE